jgi:predicted nucleotidyltransferase
LRAKKLLPKAARIGAFIHKFPFVRAVGISGSLSKNYADAKADIDYFIIAKGNRLWIARTFLHLFKKLTFLVGRQHFYCMNYFVDEKALLIKEQNIYSATEVVTLLPAAGTDMMNHFFKVNGWAEEWLPLHIAKHKASSSDRTFIVKNIFESLFNKGLGNRLDDFLFKWTTRRWQKKEQHGLRNIKGRIMNLVTDKHFSKSDPGAFQEKIIKMYEAKVDQLTNRLLTYQD